MEELIVDGNNVINPADFNKNKQELASFRHNIPTSTSLPHFKKKTWGIFDTKVTGSEANTLVTNIQTAFSEIHTREIHITDVFDTLFNAIENLDKGYLQGIIIGIKSAQKANDEAAEAIEMIKATLKTLKKFKEDLEENTSHLNDIDEMWDEIQQSIERCRTLEDILNKKTELFSSTSDVLMKFKKKLESYIHLKDVDKTFNDVTSLKKGFSSFQSKTENNLKSIKDDIINLKKHKDRLDKCIHLFDVDSMFNNIEVIKTGLEQINSLTEQRFNDFETDIKELKEFEEHLNTIEHINDIDVEWDYSHRLEECFVNSEEKLSSEIKTLKSKVKILYFLLGSTAAITIATLVLNMIGVL